MSTMVIELYEALRKVGIEDTLARDAARAVFEMRADLVTKGDLKADLAEMEVRIIKWNVGTLLAMTAIFAAIVRLVP